MGNSPVKDPAGIKGKVINRSVSPNDEMYRSKPEHYFLWGAAAYKRVDLTLKQLGKTNLRRLLVLPCGHGRELRYLKAGFPDAALTACDIDRDGVDYCVSTFGARGVYSFADPAQITLSERFDLIWCGSLVTHLDVKGWQSFLKLFYEHLEPRGVLIFSTHGKHIAEMVRTSELDVELDPETTRRVLASYDETGFGYGNYPGYTGWGVSLSSQDWIRHRVVQVLGLRLFEYVERGWFGHHDTVACIR